MPPATLSDTQGVRGPGSASVSGFDPGALATPHLCFRVHPQRIQAWCEADGLAGREPMRDGRWLPTE